MLKQEPSLEEEETFVEQKDMPDPVWTFRGYKIRPAEFNTAMVHLYRGEISRANVWRQRLDATTNWAVVTTGATISLAFNQTLGQHSLILLNALLITLFLFWEGTSISSFLLIAYKSKDEAARKGAFKSLFITGGGGIALLAGFVFLIILSGGADSTRHHVPRVTEWPLGRHRIDHGASLEHDRHRAERAPHQVLQRDREREHLAAPAAVHRHRLQEQTEAVADAERDEQHQAAEDEHRPGRDTQFHAFQSTFSAPST